MATTTSSTSPSSQNHHLIRQHSSSSSATGGTGSVATCASMAVGGAVESTSLLEWRSSAIFINPEDAEVNEILQRTSDLYTTDDDDTNTGRPENGYAVSDRGIDSSDDEIDLTEATRVSSSVAAPSVSSSGVSVPMTSLERLIRSHPIWFLPQVNRDEVLDLLRGKEQGNFIVRQSSQADTMALSVRLPGPSSCAVQHYLVLQTETKSKMKLECSDHAFENILSLIYHYCTVRDELPCILKLPQTLRESESRQNMSSVALLGKDFWRYPMSYPSCDRRSDIFTSPPPTAGQPGMTSTATAAACEGREKRNSFADHLSPCHQRALKEHQSHLVMAQKRLLDARWPPQTKAELKNRRDPGSTKRESQNFLDDTLNGLQEVSDLLQASLTELKSSRSGHAPLPPPRSSSRHASPMQSPATARKSSRQQILLPEDAREESFKEVISAPPRRRSRCNAATTPTATPPTARKQSQHIAQNGRKLSETGSVGALCSAQPTRRSPSPRKSSRAPSASPRQRRRRKSSAGRSQSPCALPLQAPLTDRAPAAPGKYYKSSIADKMSDYEDIWIDTLPKHQRQTQRAKYQFLKGEADMERSITPAESETHFKAYLAQKLLRGDQTASPEPEEYPPSKVLAKPRPIPPQLTLVNATVTPQGAGAATSTSTSTTSSSISASSCKMSVISSTISSHSSLSSRSPSSSLSSSRRLRKVSAPPILSKTSTASSARPAISESEETRSCVKEVNSFYSDPLDALEKATDTRIYHCPEFGEMSGDEAEEDAKVANGKPEDAAATNSVEESKKMQVQMRQKGEKREDSVRNSSSKPLKRLSDINMNYEDSKSPQEAVEMTESAAILLKCRKLSRSSDPITEDDPEDSGCALARVRKTGSRDASSASASASSSSGKKRENRLSAVIGKYIRPPKGLAPPGPAAAEALVAGKRGPQAWQMDSSSWEFLGHDNDADVSSSNSSSTSRGPARKTQRVEQPKDEESSQFEIQTPVEEAPSPSNSLEQRRESSSRSNDGEPLASSSSRDSVYESEEDHEKQNPDSIENNTPRDTAEKEPPEEDVVGLPSLLLPLTSSSETNSQKILSDSQSGTTSKARIQGTVLALASDPSNIFSRSVSKFVQCTEESREKNPAIVMRNMRQFMTGMKNYLLRHGEGDLLVVIDQERNELQSNEFLNVDLILEEVLHILVIKPLRPHLGRLFSQDFQRSGCLQLLAGNMRAAHGRCGDKGSEEFEVPAEYVANMQATVHTCSRDEQHIVLLRRMKEAFSPVEKLDCLLKAIRNILESPSSPRGLTVEEFCSVLAFVLIRSEATWIEMESEFIWGLLHPSLLSGEGGYYLTMLSSTIHFLKNLAPQDLPTADPPAGGGAHLSESAESAGRKKVIGRTDTKTSNYSFSSSICSGTTSSSIGTASTLTSTANPTSLRVLVPNDLNGSIVSKALPLSPAMTTKEVTKIIAHKMRITNPEDYGLYSMTGGKESLLPESARPHAIKVAASATPTAKVHFVFKRQDVIIAWPKEFLAD